MSPDSVCYILMEAPRGPLAPPACIRYQHSGHAIGVMVWAAIRCTTPISLVRIDGVAVTLAHHSSPANTVDEVQHRLEAEWHELPFSFIQTQFDSMPNWNVWKKLCLQEALDLLQNLPSEIHDVLTDDFSDEEIPANYLLEFLLDS
ncbi:hypothetical protein TNCV_2857001 [Trichonephila clavipes]|nr:hypothetical protein TNCV_2857001 [Trichonephila clavipes]